MTQFWLVRHGSTDALEQGVLAGRASSAGLNAQGRAEVDALAERLAGTAVHALYVSPIPRTLETARAIAARVGLEPIEHAALLELDFGHWTGKRLAELEREERWRLFNSFRSGTRIPGGELMLDVQARAVGVLLELRAHHPAEHVMVVTHGDVIRAVLCCLLGMPVDFFARLEISPASLSRVELGERGARVLCFNDVAHLERAS